MTDKIVEIFKACQSVQILLQDEHGLFVADSAERRELAAQLVFLLHLPTGYLAVITLNLKWNHDINDAGDRPTDGSYWSVEANFCAKALEWLSTRSEANELLGWFASMDGEKDGQDLLYDIENLRVELVKAGVYKL